MHKQTCLFLSGSTQPHFTGERAERNLTNNVAYATVNELVNVFDMYKLYTGVHTLTFQHFVRNEEAEDRLAGYETIKCVPPTTQEKVNILLLDD